MMAQPHHDHEPDKPRARRARNRWWAVGLAGMTGLTLSTGGAVVTPAASAISHDVAAAGDAPSVDDRRGKRDDGRGKHTGRGSGVKGKQPKGAPVPCDANALIAAITLANARGGATLNLAKDCTYLLTTNLDGAGLPTITLNGSKHTTIERAAAADQFRILTINVGGDLTLNNLKITGGQTIGDGGAILVNTGGRLTTNDSAITRNIADGNGGGIANNGITALRS